MAVKVKVKLYCGMDVFQSKGDLVHLQHIVGNQLLPKFMAHDRVSESIQKSRLIWSGIYGMPQSRQGQAIVLSVQLSYHALHIGVRQIWMS